MHTCAMDDDYRMELADEESNPGTSVIKKAKEEAKSDRQAKSQLFDPIRETFG